MDRPPFPCKDIIISGGGKFKKEVGESENGKWKNRWKATSGGRVD
jgi:hypothetical protein